MPFWSYGCRRLPKSLGPLAVVAFLAAGVFGGRYQSGPSITQSLSNYQVSIQSPTAATVSSKLTYAVTLPPAAPPPTSGGTAGTFGIIGGTTTASTGSSTSSSTTGTSSTGTTGNPWSTYAAIANSGSGYNTNWSMSTTTGSSGGATASLPVSSSGPNVSCTRWWVNNGDTLNLSNAVSNSGDTVTTLREVIKTHWDTHGNPTSYDHWYWRSDYKLVQTVFTAIAVDSRKINGQPDLDGETQGDPNADNRNVNFNGWTYKGGLFVGNVPWTSGDLSGTGRVQLSTTSFPTLTNCVGSVLTMLSMGQPSSFNTAFNVGCYPVPTSDPNYSQSQSTVTWATAWGLPSGSPSSGSASNSVGAGGFISFQVSPAPAMILAIQNEAAFVTAGSAGWLYFATAAYASAVGLSTTWPYNYPQPRLWTLDNTYNANWSTTGDLNP